MINVVFCHKTKEGVYWRVQGSYKGQCLDGAVKRVVFSNSDNIICKLSELTNFLSPLECCDGSNFDYRVYNIVDDSTIEVKTNQRDYTLSKTSQFEVGKTYRFNYSGGSTPGYRVVKITVVNPYVIDGVDIVKDEPRRYSINKISDVKNVQ